jgi:ferredoxin-NADP reductase
MSRAPAFHYGPPGFVEAVNGALQALGASSAALVYER